MSKKVDIVTIVIIIISLVTSIITKRYINISLIGDDIEEIEVNSNYEEKGFNACYKNQITPCKEIKNKTIIGGFDNHTLGEYKLKYVAQIGRLTKEVERTIKVVDTTPPILNVESEDKIKLCPNTQNVNFTYKAVDNYDGDITEKVINSLNNNKLIYQVTDSSYNVTQKEIDVDFIDDENPQISLQGSTTMSIRLNSSYQEPGYTALDNCDGDLTEKIKVDNNVNTKKPGSYEVIYEVEDSNGNKATKTRNVYVYEKNVVTNVPSGKTIYLTFDDGPSPYTNELLNVLAEYNVKATFFVINKSEEYNKTIVRAHNEGHAIGIHSYTHNYNQIYSSMDAYFNDLNLISKKIERLIGESPKIVRFPGGGSNTVSRITPKIMTKLSQELEARGYKYFDWNVSSGDAGLKNTNQIINNVINGLGNNSTYIVLQHDTNSYSVKGVRTIIEYGLSHGYTFRKLDITSPTIHHKINN